MTPGWLDEDELEGTVTPSMMVSSSSLLKSGMAPKRECARAERRVVGSSISPTMGGSGLPLVLAPAVLGRDE